MATLRGAIVDLSRDASSTRELLVQAHVYRGAAFVGLLQEEAARLEFYKVLALQPERRLQKGEFPDRVVRVFEAARKGETDSVLQRPPGAVKKTGHAAKVAWQIAGVTVVAGAAGLLLDKLLEVDVPAPTPSPSPRPSAAVVPQAGNFGPIRWLGELTVPGGAAQVLVNGGGAGALRKGTTELSGSLRGGVNHVEAVLTEGHGPGTWRFTFPEGTALEPGSLTPLLGEIAQVGPLTIVFRSTGRSGERVAFTFRMTP